MESPYFLVSTDYFWCYLTLLWGEDKGLPLKLITALGEV